MYKEIADTILATLKANATLKKEIRAWYFGEHDIRKPNTRYPFIDVKWIGGPVTKLKTGAVITRRKIGFQIRVIAQHYDEDKAEKKVMELTELIESIFDVDQTLGGTVVTSTITDIISDSIPIGGYSVVGSATTFIVKRRLS